MEVLLRLASMQIESTSIRQNLFRRTRAFGCRPRVRTRPSVFIVYFFPFRMARHDVCGVLCLVPRVVRAAGFVLASCILVGL
jgi:hypothetical protein